MSSEAGRESTPRPDAVSGKGSAQRTDHNLLFGVLALELDLVDASQFAEACAAWAVRKDVSLAEILKERGWLDEEGNADVEKLLARRLRKHGGDVRRSLSTAADDSVRELISDIDDARVRETLSELPPSQKSAYIQLETVEFKPESRSHYTLTRLHGRGGLGRVWLARDVHLNRQVALKEILPGREGEPGTELRLVREAQVTGQLEHPNIVPVYELSKGEEDEKLFYVMRYVRGRTLRAAIKEYHEHRNEGTADPVELHRLLQSFVDICNAVEYAHSRGIIHRDLKPSNVMLGPFGEVTVVDWGLAKVVGQPDAESEEAPVRLAPLDRADLTQYGQALGTLGYMAPEQADPSAPAIDRRADVYGLGSILYEILTSHAPHRGTNSEELRSRIIHAPTPRVRAEASCVPAALDAICAKAMAKKRSDRYRSAAELADDVEHWLADEPISVFCEPWSHRVFRWMRRHRACTVSTAVVLAIVTLTSIVAFFVVDHARRGEKLANARAQAALAAEEDAKAEALGRFKQSLDTVDVMLTGVSEVLEYYPGTQRLRSRLLERAAGDYARFSAEDSGDPELATESARALMRLGDVYRRLARHEEAVDAFRRASARFDRIVSGLGSQTELGLQSIECLTRLAEVEAEAGSHEAAERTFAEVETRLDSSMDSDDSRRARARFQVGLALLKDELGHAEEGIGLLDEAQSAYDQLASREMESRAADLENLALVRSIRGRILVGQGRQQEAVEPIEAAIRVYRDLAEQEKDEPRHVERLAFSRIHLANALRGLGRVEAEVAALEAAVVDLEALLASMPDVPYLSENLAISHVALGRVRHYLGQNQAAKDHLDRALGRLERLVGSDSPLPRHYASLAVACTVQGQILRDLGAPFAERNLDTAKQLYDQLLDKYPESADYWRGLAVCQRHLARLLHGDGRFGEARLVYQNAVDSFEKALALNAEDPYSRDGLARCREHFGDLRLDLGEDAEEDYGAALAIRRTLGETPEDRYRLAQLQLKVGDAAEAAKAMRELTTSVPENPNYWTLLGAAAFRAGDVEASIDALERRQPAAGDGTHQFWLSMALRARGMEGDQERAREVYQSGIELMEKNAPSRIEAIKLRKEAARILGLTPSAQPEGDPAPEASRNLDNLRSLGNSFCVERMVLPFG